MQINDDSLSDILSDDRLSEYASGLIGIEKENLRVSESQISSNNYESSLDYYKKLLKRYSHLKMVCTNPDLVVHRGLKREYCAGTLAEIFKKLGGKVIYFGKPYTEIYNFCMKKNENILVIGDNIQTDIKGANNMKLDSLFITGGIHKKDFLNFPISDYDKILEKYGTKTNYYQESLSW